MYCIYNGQLYLAVKKGDKIRIGSDVRGEVFINYIDVLGKVHNDRFVKFIDYEELDYLYRISYKIKYKGRVFRMSNTFRRDAIDEDCFVLEVDSDFFRIKTNG